MSEILLYIFYLSLIPQIYGAYKIMQHKLHKHAIIGLKTHKHQMEAIK